MSNVDEEMMSIIQEINSKLGSDSYESDGIQRLHKEYLCQKQEFEAILSLTNSEVSSQISTVIEKADEATAKIKTLKNEIKSAARENDEFLSSVESIKNDLNELLADSKKLEVTKEYLESLQTVRQISQDLKSCTDSEQSVLLVQQLYEMRKKYNKGHRGEFIKESTHYWYNVLRDKLSKEFEEVLKLIKWPITSTNLSSLTNVTAESMAKFKEIVQYLFEIQMPEEDNVDTRVGIEPHLCLPVNLMLVPLKKRFTFHFSGNRRTNRLDRPEWFLTQILSWLRDHLPFLAKNLQPIANGLDIKINVQMEFTCGLVQLAVDRLHLLLSTIVGDNSLFSHAIDECLGFDRELEGTVGFILPPQCPRVTSVLTDARYIVRWLAVEKKFAIQKIDEMLTGTEWLLSIRSGNLDTNDESENIPQGADWLLSLLQTIHDRYSLLPQPGHRLQFLEMQIEICEEIRVRLTQMIGEELRHGSNVDNRRNLEGGVKLLALLNVAHHFRRALIDWTHSVTYLQLHYYKKQFHCFTEMQHLSIPDVDTTPVRKPTKKIDESKGKLSRQISLSLSQVEEDSQQLAQHDAEVYDENLTTQNINVEAAKEDTDLDGVFEELPGLFSRLVDNACSLLCDDLVLEVRAVSRDYRNQKWHYIPEVSNPDCRSLSPALCAPLGALTTRLMRLKSALAPELFAPLWRTVAKEIDVFIYEEVVLECWWGTGGIQQFNFDMNRNLMPIFAQYTAHPEAHLPRIAESCKLLTMLKGTALLVRETLKNASMNSDLDSNRSAFEEMGIFHLCHEDIGKVLNQRTDLSQM